MKRLALLVGLTLFYTMPSANAEGDAERGESSYNANCAGCHRDAVAIAAGIKGETENDKSAGLESFLSRHFAPDADVRADIIVYLIALGGN